MLEKKYCFKEGDLVNVIPDIVYKDPDNFSYELKQAVDAGVTFRIRQIDFIGDDEEQEIYLVNNDDDECEIEECVYPNEIRLIRRDWDE